MSLTTLGKARELLWNYWSGDTFVAYASRVAADTAAWDNALNQVSERLIRSGKWRGSIVSATFTVVDHQITLPESLDCMLGATPVDDEQLNAGRPLSVYGPWHEYIPNGIGKLDGSNASMSGVIDKGDQWATFRDSPYATFTIRATTDQTESGKTILLRGLDQLRKVVYTAPSTEGVSLSLNAASQDTTQQFTFLSYWVKSAATNGVVRLYAVDTVTAEASIIAIIMPGKLVSGYRRYSLPGAADEDVYECLCKRDFVAAVADNDPIFPSNIGALKKGLQALRYEDKNDDERAEIAWAKAFELLEQEEVEYSGDNASSAVHFTEGAGDIQFIL